MAINGLEIDNIIKSMSTGQAENLYYDRSKDSRFKYIAKGKEGVVYKLGHYAIKFMKNSDRSNNEIVAIKKIINRPEFINFIRFYCVKEIGDYTVYVMNLAKDHLRNWYKDKHSDCDWISMLFQILVGMYQLNIILGMYHNDLKRKNVLYDDSPQVLHYNINGIEYQIKTKSVFYISDFSHASKENKHVANISDEYFVKYELFRKIFTDVMSTELCNDKYSIKYVEDYIFDGKPLTDEYKQYYKEKEASIKKKFGNNKKMYDYIMKKTIASYGIEHNMIDITPFKSKISSPSKQVIDLFENLDYSDLEKSIGEVYALYSKLC